MTVGVALVNLVVTGVVASVVVRLDLAPDEGWLVVGLLAGVNWLAAGWALGRERHSRDERGRIR